jgi:serine/threonine-protein kinase
MPSFEIPDSPAQLELRNQAVDGKAFRVANTAFTVTNKTTQPLSARFRVVPQGDAKAEWFQLEGEKERPFGASETQKVNVTATVPGDVPAGDYKFRLVAMNVNDPGNDFTESAVVTFSPPKVTTTGTTGPMWPYIVAAVVLVLIVGGVGAYIFLKPTPPPSNTIAIPNVVTNPAMTFAAARQKLIDAGFTDVATTPTTAAQATGAPPGDVIGQTPTALTQVPKNKPITLTVDPGVAVPGGLVGTNIANVGSALSGFSTSVTQLQDGQTSNIIASFSPASGTFALHAPLMVYVHGPACTFVNRLLCIAQVWQLEAFKQKKLKVK